MPNTLKGDGTTALLGLLRFGVRRRGRASVPIPHVSNAGLDGLAEQPLSRETRLLGQRVISVSVSGRSATKGSGPTRSSRFMDGSVSATARRFGFGELLSSRRDCKHD